MIARHAALAVAAAAALLAATLFAAAQPSGNGKDGLPKVYRGIGPDRRDRISVDQMPWRAVGRLQFALGAELGHCTGAMIGPATVLTAAHCLFEPHSHSKLPLGTLHFLLAFEQDHYAGVAEIAADKIGPGYDPRDEKRTGGSDWAVLTLDRKLADPGHVLALRVEPPADGTAVMIGGYSRDFPLYITVDSRCQILSHGRDANGHELLVHDCVATRGASGAPVLVHDGSTWTIAGVDVTAAPDYTRCTRGSACGVATVPDALPEPR